MTSRALGFKVMDPFDWTKDKAICKRWQMWSEKARHALEAMEGNSEKTKISYFHHWVDSDERPRLSHGRIARHSLARRTMRNLMKLKVVVSCRLNVCVVEQQLKCLFEQSLMGIRSSKCTKMWINTK